MPLLIPEYLLRGGYRRTYALQMHMHLPYSWAYIVPVSSFKGYNADPLTLLSPDLDWYRIGVASEI